MHRRFPLLLVAVFAIALSTAIPGRAREASPAAPSSGTPKTGDGNDRSAAFFSGPIQHFEVRLTKPNIESLRHEPRKPVPATVLVGTNVFEDVAVHVKGAAGSGRPIDDNPALTLNFDKFKSGQRCFGLHKLHLNNSVQDSSRLNELVASELYLHAGVPTPRTTHALVSLNRRDVGLYVLKEGFDRTFLARHFRDPSGNLYDGGFVSDIDHDLERDAGKGTNDFADLRRLREALTAQNPTERLAQIERVLDVDRFLTLAAIQIATDDWDGYVRNRNNYRLYHEPATDRFVFLPHGMDQLFGNTGSTIEPGLGGMVARRLLSIPPVRERLYARLAELMSNGVTVEAIEKTVAGAEARLRVAMDGRSRDEVRELFGDIENARQGMKARIANVQRQLSRRVNPPRFDTQGEMRLTGWEPRRSAGNSRHAQEAASPGPTNLTIESEESGSVGSWRTKIRLEPGQYTFVARAMTRGVEPIADANGQGAGIRISGGKRNNKLVGDADWQTLTFEFEQSAPGEVELVAELRANRGTVRFDSSSLKLLRH